MRRLHPLIATVLLVLSGAKTALCADAPELTTALIQKVLSAAVAKAQELKVPMGIAVVDAGGSLVGFIRMEGAFIHTYYTSQAKAYTAASVRKPTHATGIPANVAAEIVSATGARFTTLAGGFPLVLEGKTLGGIGVGGGNAEQDIAVAKAGAEALTAPSP